MTSASGQYTWVWVMCVLCTAAEGLPSPSKFDEYLVEHEVSSGQARNAALALDPDSLSMPLGCQECTEAEMRYCEGVNFVHDHCCCDRRFHEELPYIPHTCYFGKQLCRPVAGHCDDYTMIRRCCCDRHALKLWKAKASSAASTSIHRRRTVSLFCCVVLYFLIVIVFNRAYCKI